MDPTSRYLQVIRGTNRSPLARITRVALGAASGAYRVGIAARNASFATGLRRAHRLPRPTLSVGNLTVGGTGKTPMVIELARRLQARGEHPAVLLRGYRAGPSGSDEAALLSEQLGNDVPIQTGSSRRSAADRVLAQHPDVSVFLLDDGFQHRQIKRDLDIVLVDATRPFGFGHVLPRGLLREPQANLRRANAVILTRCDQAKNTAELDRLIEKLTGQPPIAHAAYEWSGLRDADGHRLDADRLRTAAVLGICGIGNPSAFEWALRRAAGRVTAIQAMPDHYDYTTDDLVSAMDTANKHRADAIVTTEKDWVKWRPLLNTITRTIPIYRPVVATRFLRGDAEVNALLTTMTQRLPSTNPPPCKTDRGNRDTPASDLA